MQQLASFKVVLFVLINKDCVCHIVVTNGHLFTRSSCRKRAIKKAGEWREGCWMQRPLFYFHGTTWWCFFLFRYDGVAGNSLRNSLHDACRAVLSRKSHRDSLKILCAQKIVGWKLLFWHNMLLKKPLKNKIVFHRRPAKWLVSSAFFDLKIVQLFQFCITWLF